MFESTVNRVVEGDPPELSSTYFFVAASVLALGAPTFVSFFHSAPLALPHLHEIVAFISDIL